MAADYRKSITFRLARASRAYRTRAAQLMTAYGIHPGQDSLLKTLAESDAQTMGALASALEVRPPTITKMISRLSAQGLVRRESSTDDARLARVYLTEEGRARAALIDKTWIDIEVDALAGIDAKDRKKLRKLLRRIERNLGHDPGVDDEDETVPVKEAVAG
ncbi:MAG: MarR family transcriptional regulator [Hyphomicrobiales bacterium]|nr:MarR family transcriptional regulator [Hyphomicrobiales bacterium]